MVLCMYSCSKQINRYGLDFFLRLCFSVRKSALSESCIIKERLKVVSVYFLVSFEHFISQRTARTSIQISQKAAISHNDLI